MHILPLEKCLSNLYESMWRLHGGKKCVSQVSGNLNWGTNRGQTQLNLTKEARTVRRKKNEWVFENFEREIKKNSEKAALKRNHQMEQRTTAVFRWRG